MRFDGITMKIIINFNPGRDFGWLPTASTRNRYTVLVPIYHFDRC